MSVPPLKRTFDTAFTPTQASPAPIYSLTGSGRDLFPLVLRYLPTIQDVSRVRLCCSQFKQAVSTLPAEFFRPYIENYKQTPRKMDKCYYYGDRQGIRIFKKYAPQLNNLKIHAQHYAGEGLYETLEDFKKLASQAERIIELDWDFLNPPKTSELKQQIALLDSFKNLTHVNLYYSFFTYFFKDRLESFHTSLFRALASLEKLHTCTICYDDFNTESYRFQDIAWPNLKHLRIYFGARKTIGKFVSAPIHANSCGGHQFLENICTRLQNFQHLDCFTLLACTFNLIEGETGLGEVIKKLIDRIPTKSCELQFNFIIIKCGSEYKKHATTLRVTKTPEFSITCWIDDALYDGPFNYYLPHGEGKLVAKCGKVVFKGEFKEGIPDSSAMHA